MKEFSDRLYEKLSKLSQGQLEDIFLQLISQNEMMKALIQSLPVGVVTVDENWKMTEFNKAAERLLPFLPDYRHSKNQDSKVFELIDSEEIKDFLKDCSEKDKSNVSEEFSITSKNGITKFISISLIPLLQKEKIQGTIITVEDKTEERMQEILLHRMETLASLTNVAASVAHEIKNPLGSISIHIQLMQKAVKKRRESDGLLPEKKFMEDYLELVNGEIDRLNKIVVDFLMAVRPIAVNPALVNPDSVIEKFIGFITPEFSEKHIKIEKNLVKDCPRLLIDEKLFREVVANISLNALAAIEERAGEIRNGEPFGENYCGKLKIDSYINDDKYFLVISDNGIGMNEEVRERVFEPYYTTKANGTGLGMAMAFKIIREFSGEISVKSEVGQGTSFTIEIPLPQTKTNLIAHSKKLKIPAKMTEEAE